MDPNEVIILGMQARPNLWKKRDSLYPNADMVNKSWKEICENVENCCGIADLTGKAFECQSKMTVVYNKHFLDIEF